MESLICVAFIESQLVRVRVVYDKDMGLRDVGVRKCIEFAQCVRCNVDVGIKRDGDLNMGRCERRGGA